MYPNFKAILLDQDQTLTRCPPEIFPHATYDVHVELLTELGRQADIRPREDIFQIYTELTHKNINAVTGTADRFGLCADRFIAHFNDRVDLSKITFDVESVPMLDVAFNQILIFTDAPRPWASKMQQGVGHKLDMQTPTDLLEAGAVHQVKGTNGVRWDMALEQLRTKMNDPTLQMSDILVIDDHQTVLKVARERGCKTGLALYGLPDNAPIDTWDYLVPHVGTFLVEQGFVDISTKRTA